MTRGIVLALLACLVASAADAAILVYENWESGIDTDVWHLFGSPSPMTYGGPGAAGTLSLEDLADETLRSGCAAKQTFTLRGGLSLSYDININATGDAGPWSNNTECGWCISTSDPTAITESDNGSGATFALITHSPQDGAHQLAGGATAAISPDYATWITWRLVVQADGTVFYYRDGAYVGHSGVGALESIMGDEACLFYAGMSAAIVTLVDEIEFAQRDSAQLLLPDVTCDAGGSVDVTIASSVTEALSAGLAFTVDASVIESVTILSHAFENDPYGGGVCNVSGDTVFVGLYGNEPLTLADEPIVTLRIRVRESSPAGTAAMAWVASETTVDDEEALLNDGSLFVPAPPLYGDATGDGNITADDAARVLQKYVRLPVSVDETLADVSGNGRLSPYDAALIIYRVVHADYVFPVEGGLAPPRPTGGTHTVALTAGSRGWLCTIDDPAGVLSGGITLASAGDAVISGPAILSTNRDGDVLRVAFVRNTLDDPLLFRLESATQPTILSAELNERPASVAEAVPTALSLSAAVPNPFNPSTAISFSLPEATAARLTVYTTTGQLVHTLADGALPAGRHTVTWNARDFAGRPVAAGVYLYRLEADGRSVTRRMVVVR